MKKVQTGFLSAFLAHHHSLTQHAHHTHTHTHVLMYTCTHAHVHTRTIDTHTPTANTHAHSLSQLLTRVHAPTSSNPSLHMDELISLPLSFFSFCHFRIMFLFSFCLSLSFSLLFLYLSSLILVLTFSFSKSSLSFFLNSSFSKQKLTGSQANLNRYCLQNYLFAVLVKVWFYSMILYELIRPEL